MKNIKLEKRKNNILIATILSILCYILNALLIIPIRLVEIPFILEWILIIILLLYIIFVLPSIILKLQTAIYDRLCKNIDIVECNLSHYYTPIYLNTSCLNTFAIPLHLQRIYLAKLEDDGKITIRIEDNSSNEVFEEQTTDYSWFLYMFRFEV